MKKSVRKLTAFTSAAALMMSCSMSANAVEYKVNEIVEPKYDESIQMLDKTYFTTGNIEFLDSNTELIVVDREGQVKNIDASSAAGGIYSYISTTMGNYNYICPSPEGYSNPFMDRQLRFSTEEEATIVSVGDEYALMDNDGKIVSDTYKNIYWIGGGYYMIDESDDNTYSPNDPTGFTDNYSGLMDAKGNVIIEPTNGIIGFYICSDGEHFAVDTEKGDYFIDSKGRMTSAIYSHICGVDEYYPSGNWNTAEADYKALSKFARDYYFDNAHGATIKNNGSIYYVTSEAKVLDKESIDYMSKIDGYYDRDGHLKSSGYNLLVKNGKTAVIDLEGNKIVDYSDKVDYLGGDYYYRGEQSSPMRFVSFNGDQLDIYNENGKNIISVIVPGVTSEECTTFRFGRNQNGVRYIILGGYDPVRYALTTDDRLVDISAHCDDVYSIGKLGDNVVTYDVDEVCCYFYNKSGNVVKKLKSATNDFQNYYTKNGKTYGLFYDTTSQTTTVLDEELNVLWDSVEGRVMSDYFNNLSYWEVNMFDSNMRCGIFTVEKGVIAEPSYISVNYITDDLFVVKTPDNVKVINDKLEDLYVLDDDYVFEAVTSGAYIDSCLTFNWVFPQSPELCRSVVYNYKDNKVVYEQVGEYYWIGSFFNGYASYKKANPVETDSDSYYQYVPGIIDIKGNEFVPAGGKVQYVDVDQNGITVFNMFFAKESFSDIPKVTKLVNKYDTVVKQEELYIVTGPEGYGICDIEGNELLTPNYRELCCLNVNKLGSKYERFVSPRNRSVFADNGYYNILKRNSKGGYNVIVKIDDKIGMVSIDRTVPEKQGDSNGDSEINMSDVVIVMQASLNPVKYGYNGTSSERITYQGYLNSDVDGKSGVDLADALVLQQFILKINTSL